MRNNVPNNPDGLPDLIICKYGFVSHRLDDSTHFLNPLNDLEEAGISVNAGIEPDNPTEYNRVSINGISEDTCSYRYLTPKEAYVFANMLMLAANRLITSETELITLAQYTINNLQYRYGQPTPPQH